MIERRGQLWRMGIAGSIAVMVVLSFVVRDSGSKLNAGSGPLLTMQEVPELVTQALSADSTVNDLATKELRRRGPPAVNYLMNQRELRGQPRWTQVLDAVAQQKDAALAGLYWYTNLDDALAAAKREKKPVISLRLLGNLTDELSCANSRFFRTTLYPNPKVSELMRDQFVLHWVSVRKVPIITIDFGDGRQLKRTITGNSLHLVLDEQGRPVDVLPGLYAAADFVPRLEQAGRAAVHLGPLTGEEFAARRLQYHRDQLQKTQEAWNEVCTRAGLAVPLPIGINHPLDVWSQLTKQPGKVKVLANEAQTAVNYRQVRQDPRGAPPVPRAAPPVIPDVPNVAWVGFWARRTAPSAVVASARTTVKMVGEQMIVGAVQNVSDLIAVDSLRNEFFMHVQIHNWFNYGMPAAEPKALVARVYSELFLSPLDDPWYGLSRPDVYSAIKNDGRIHAVAQNASY